jgi:hypothetical protein
VVEPVPDVRDHPVDVEDRQPPILRPRHACERKLNGSCDSLALRPPSN